MARVKNGATTKARHKKVLKSAKGYFGSKHRLYKSAKEQVMHSRRYAYNDRKKRKNDFRKLWITRINAACREHEISYSMFINGLNKAGVEINRKMLSEIAIDNPENFAEIVKVAKAGLNGEIKSVENNKKEEVTVNDSIKEKAKKEVNKEDMKDKIEIEKMTVAELREMAKKKGIKGVSTMKKEDLINALK